MKTEMRLSFIIIGKNEEKNIRRTIKSIQENNFINDYEIIVNINANSYYMAIYENYISSTDGSEVTACEWIVDTENKHPYEVVSDERVNIYNNVNVTEIAIALSQRNCIINEFHEIEESLENYYINFDN